MLNFNFYNPTKVIFGKDTYNQLSTLIPAHAKVMVTYGMNSIKENGIYEEVMKHLTSFEVVEFSGIGANPSYEHLMKALEIIKKEKITFILAIGGGSVIDGTKFLSSAALYQGDDCWDILKKGIRTEVGLPFGTILTLPATGSEMNSGAVITKESTQEKLGMGGPGLFPQFSILNPEVVKSIPKRQLQNGIIDAYTHVLEQYLTYPTQAYLQDRIAESILKTLIEITPALLQKPYDYTIAGEYMWCCTMALNGLIQKGVPTDWATHMIGHELTAAFNIDHARTLAIIAPQLYEVQFEDKKEKLAQYALRVWSVNEENINQAAYLGIEKTKQFFKQVGVDLKLSDYTNKHEGIAHKIAQRFEERGWKALGERKNINPEKVKMIVEKSI